MMIIREFMMKTKKSMTSNRVTQIGSTKKTRITIITHQTKSDQSIRLIPFSLNLTIRKNDKEKGLTNQNWD